MIHYGRSDGCLFSVLSNWVLLAMLCLCSQCLSFHIWGCILGANRVGVCFILAMVCFILSDEEGGNIDITSVLVYLIWCVLFKLLTMSFTNFP